MSKRTRSAKSQTTAQPPVAPAQTPVSSVSYPSSPSTPPAKKKGWRWRPWRVLRIYIHRPYKMTCKVLKRRKKTQVVPPPPQAQHIKERGFFGKLAHGLTVMTLIFFFIILTLRVEKEYEVSDQLISAATRIGRFVGIKPKTPSQPTPAEIVSNLRKKASQDLMVNELLALKARSDEKDREILSLRKASEEDLNLKQELILKLAGALAIAQNDIKNLKKELEDIDAGAKDFANSAKSRIESVEQRLDKSTGTTKEDIVIAVKGVLEETRKEESKSLKGLTPNIQIASQPATDIVAVPQPAVNPLGESTLVPIGKETRRYSRSEILNKRISWDSYNGVDFYGQKKDGSWIKLEAPLDGPTLANVHYVKMSSKIRPFYVSEKPQSRYSLN